MPAARAPAHDAGAARVSDSSRSSTGRSVQGRELRARGRRTRQRLLDAGATVFETRGYHATRVDDVVQAAKISHGTFYLYFANKEDLFQSLALDVAERMLELARHLGEVTPDAAGRTELRAWLEQFDDLYAQCGAVINAWTTAATADSEFGRLGAAVLAEFARVFSERIAGHAPADLDPEVASLALIAMFDRFASYSAANVVQASRTTGLDTLAIVTHAGIFGAGAAAP